MGTLRTALESLLPKGAALQYASNEPVWVAAARPMDDRSDRRPEDMITADECRQLAQTFDPRRRRVAWVTDPTAQFSSHWSYLPVGEVVDVDFDGTTLWLATRSLVDPVSGASLMDSFIAAGWWNQSISLQAKSGETDGRAMLLHCALLPGGEQRAIMSLPYMDEYDFGGLAAPEVVDDLSRTDQPRQRRRSVAAATSRLKAASIGTPRPHTKRITPEELMDTKALAALIGDAVAAGIKAAGMEPASGDPPADPATEPKTDGDPTPAPQTAEPAGEPATDPATDPDPQPEQLGRDRAARWADLLVAGRHVLPSQRTTVVNTLARQTVDEATATRRLLQRSTYSQGEVVAASTPSGVPMLNLDAPQMPKILDKSTWGEGISPESAELVAGAFAMLRSQGYDPSKASPGQLRAAAKAYQPQMAARREEEVFA